MPKQCNACNGKVIHKMTHYTQWYNGQLMVIENVPTWVCEQCGETYYDPDVVARIQRLLWSDETPARTITVSVYDW